MSYSSFNAISFHSFQNFTPHSSSSSSSSKARVKKEISNIRHYVFFLYSTITIIPFRVLEHSQSSTDSYELNSLLTSELSSDQRSPRYFLHMACRPWHTLCLTLASGRVVLQAITWLKLSKHFILSNLRHLTSDGAESICYGN